MKYSKDISAYIEQRYGIAYSIRTINQMKRQLKLRPTFNESADFSSICSDELGYLLNGILSKSYDIYYTWRVVSSSKNSFHHSTLFFASRSKCMIREMKVNDVVSDVIKQICCQIYGGFEENSTNHYCVFAYLEDICGDCNDLLTQKIK